MSGKSCTFTVRLVRVILSALALLFALGAAWALLYARVGMVEVRVGTLEKQTSEIGKDVKALLREGKPLPALQDCGTALGCGEDD